MPKIVDKEEKRYQIIEAAVRVFAKHGVPNTKMVQIAEAAGIGKGTIYEYFKSKEELFHAIIAMFMQNMDTQMENNIRQLGDAKEKLLACFNEWGNIFESEFMDFAEIMLDFWAECLRKGDRNSIDLNEMYEGYRKQLKEILDEGVEKGVFKPDIQTHVLASIIIGGVDGIMIQWILNKSLFSPREAVEQFAKVTIDGITINS